MSRLLRSTLWLAAFLAALFPLLAAADPPARVGRLSLLEGNVTFRTDRQDAGGPATVNWPISSGAILDTERGSRAEVRVGSSAFRLNGGSRAEFTAVDEQRVALQLAQGNLAVTVRDRDQADGIDISTPAGQVRFGTPGRYRIDVDEDSGDTQVSSREGTAYIYRPGGELTVSSGQQAVAYAAGGWFVTDWRPDAFDDWADARDAASHAPKARRYVSPQMTGYEDLDRYGSWTSSPDYGQVWYPSAIPAGWAPYRYGRWAWVPPWGWTWIDEAPWGFAPFHYGRWVLIGGQWAWVPGTYVARPVYAPALVAWIGNPGWSVSFSFGSSPAVGWFPLAPREVFVPAYRCSPTYVRQVNITNVTNVTVIDRVVAGHERPAFIHRSMPQAVTVVPARVVQSGSVITQAALRQPNRRELAQAPIAARAPGAAWLPPAATALRPRRDDAADRRLAPAQRIEAPSPKQSIAPNDPTPAPAPTLSRPQPFHAEPDRRTARPLPPPAVTQPTPAAPKAGVQIPQPPPRHEAEARMPAPVQPQAREHVQPPRAPTSVREAAPRTPPEIRPERRTGPRELHPDKPPGFERRIIERQAQPPAAVQVQPLPPSPPRHFAPPNLPAQPPAMREAAPRPAPVSPKVEAPAPPRPPLAVDPRHEPHDNRHERGKAPNAPRDADR